MNKKIILLLLVFGIVTVVSTFSFLLYYKFRDNSLISPLGKSSFPPAEKPLEKYTFENLKKRVFTGSEITFGKMIKDEPDFSSYIFYFTSEGKKVSGLANIPKKKGKIPVIVQFRGYIDRTIYETGMGTVHSGEVFAKNGFLTLAPDFLGYGESASPSADSIEERFETYTTALNLLASVKNLNQADREKVGLWGHSNGGHIALSVLEITGATYPTALWNPVSKPFPYSILYYTDEFEDHGKTLRKVLANFEKDYDAEKYSLTNYFDWINATIELHQAQDDEAVPLVWSNQLYNELKKLKKDITYFTYPGDNHDFNRGSWPKVVERNIAFYKEKFAD